MRLSGKKIAFLVADGVEELEFYVPFMRLQEEGADVVSAGVKTGTVKGKGGMEVTVDATIESLRSAELFGVVVPGGWAPDKMRRYDDVKRFVRDIHDAGKIVGLICHAGLVGISAGIVKSHTATGSLGIKDDLVNAGATWADEAAFRSGNLVWGRVVADIPDFCRELVAAIEKP